jgi:hypothetical protein
VAAYELFTSGIKVATAINMKVNTFWDVTSFSLIGRNSAEEICISLFRVFWNSSWAVLK